jgi:broad specificity phosphatase PhoE
MTRLVLVRHGQTLAHAENRYAGRTDVALTEEGIRQAQQLAAWARTATLAAVWSSPLERARLTAGPSAAMSGLPMQIDERLIEIDFGEGEGLTDREMHQRFRAKREAFIFDPAANPLPGGEDPHAAAVRGEAALRFIASMSPNARTLIVAHNTLFRLALCQMLELPLSRYRALFPKFDTCAITEIGLGDSGSVSLLSLNVPLSST